MREAPDPGRLRRKLNDRAAPQVSPLRATQSGVGYNPRPRFDADQLDRLVRETVEDSNRVDPPPRTRHHRKRFTRSRTGAGLATDDRLKVGTMLGYGAGPTRITINSG